MIGEIEDLIEINSKLSTWNLIYSKLKLKWKILGVLIVMIALVVFISSLWLYFFDSKILLSIIYFIIGTFLLLSFVFVMNKYETKIIKEKYPLIFLQFEKRKSKAIRKIQRNEFVNLINNDKVFEKDNLLFTIECLKREIENKSFKYLFSINVIIILVGIYFGALLSGYASFAKNLDELFELFKIIGFIVSYTFIMIFVIEVTFLRDIFDTRRKKRNRLIRLLENIYLEKHIF